MPTVEVSASQNVESMAFGPEVCEIEYLDLLVAQASTTRKFFSYLGSHKTMAC